MINGATLFSITVVFATYIFVIFTMIPRMRKLLKIWLYILVFVGLLFPEFQGIGELKLNLETYAIVLAGIEAFEMLFKFIVEEKLKQGKKISTKIKVIYDNM